MNVNLTTRYLGLSLSNPLVVSSNPLTGEIYNLQRLEAAGAAAVVLPSLFEEQLCFSDECGIERYHDCCPPSGASESMAYGPDLTDYNAGPDSYLRFIAGAKKSLDIPVIASLNGTCRGEWTHFARLMEGAGADALELNIHVLPTSADMTGEEVEFQYLSLVHEIRSRIAIPLAVKISPYFSSLPNFARQLVAVGADGLVLFNRFLIPDLQLETSELTTHLKLSSPEELRLPLRWIPILRPQIDVSLAATGGVHNAEDALKLLTVGADAVMMASALLTRGPHFLTEILAEMGEWMESHGYNSLEEMHGKHSSRKILHIDSAERTLYMKAITAYSRLMHEKE